MCRALIVVGVNADLIVDTAADQVSIDTDDNQGSAHTVAVPEVPVAFVEQYFATVTVPVYNSHEPTNAAIRGSPPLHTVPLYLANCVFRN